jgi:hypothetical protein
MKPIVIKYGLVMFLGFLGFFLVMHALSLVEHYNLRIFNGVIHLGVMTLAIQRYQKVQPAEFSNYMGGVATGVLTSAVGVTLFCIFQLIYLAANAGFMQYLQENVPYIGEYLTPFTAALSIFMEGLAVSVIGSYIITRIIYAANERRVNASTNENPTSTNSAPIPSSYTRPDPPKHARMYAGISAAKASSNAERARLN